MDKETFRKAGAFWNDHEEEEDMPRNELKDHIDEFLKSHNTLALATAPAAPDDESMGEVRCTPLEYSWKNDTLVIISEGGQKFYNLMDNDRVSASVFDVYENFGSLSSMQIYGSAQVDELNSETAADFEEYLSFPVSTFEKIAHSMYLIRIKPIRIDVLCSAFKQMGYDSRQTMEFGN